MKMEALAKGKGKADNLIKGIWATNMILVIERWECEIAAGGSQRERGYRR